MGKGKQNKFFDMKMSANNSNSADIFIYGEITKYAWEEYGEHSATTFKNELDALGDDLETINLYVNSPGGSVFEGVTIHNMLKRHKARVIAHVDALAASIASVIIMAADEIRMPSNSMLMIHNPWTFAIGNSAELRKQADDLDRIGNSSKQSYLQKAGDKITDEKLQELLDAETWLSAEEAYSYGLCDVVEDANQMAASVSDDLFAKYKNVPKHLKLVVNNSQIEDSGEEIAMRKKIAEEAKVNASYLNTILGGII
ncbi:head maturation protease, ClpP-related [Cytobacillus purgationiresistens]|uniref:ATP-dependent Clp protease proteolytic subunit n=1 Tax=Cytobacillus purgationiresistens TaxID=863449 RepID=A0ABU0ADR3_9BACI|nr:head maturation protease, ClpP-related [Cytobacillus purgationiresistens]MDQ0268881.1 ATP-dependent Clp endopeptidase proteolytic subunit ClpP [Cytobacillus purgationiresistens]